MRSLCLMSFDLCHIMLERAIMMSFHLYLMRYHVVSRDSLPYELSPLQRILCAKKPS